MEQIAYYKQGRKKQNIQQQQKTNKQGNIRYSQEECMQM